MTVINIVLFFICIGEFFYILHIRNQLTEWLDFLKSVHQMPERNYFVKGNGILADINYELNGILEKSRRQFVKLQKAETASRQLLTNLSHDVKTPLASLIGYLESLDSQTAKDREEYTHVAYRKALDLQELIDTLFQWFKLTSHEQLYQMKVYDINELTRELLIEHIPVFEKKQISFSVNIPDNECFINIDKMAYARIINNLLSNAVKHGKCSLIEIKIQESKDHVQVLVSNNGIAIPYNELPLIFQRLYKCDASRSETGNGLGLAIVRELITSMSGEITVQSAQGEMTTFCLTLPLIVRKN